MVQSDEIYSDCFGPIFFDPTAWLLGQISQRQWKITHDRPTESDMLDYRRLSPIIISRPTQILPLARSYIPSPPPSVRQWDAGLKRTSTTLVKIGMRIILSCLQIIWSNYWNKTPWLTLWIMILFTKKHIKRTVSDKDVRNTWAVALGRPAERFWNLLLCHTIDTPYCTPVTKAKQSKKTLLSPKIPRRPERRVKRCTKRKGLDKKGDRNLIADYIFKEIHQTNTILPTIGLV